MQSNQSSAVAGLAPDTAPLEVLPRDISAYRLGNTGIDYVHRFESGKPGPDVLVNGLTHGNEICGMVAVTYLLDRGYARCAGLSQSAWPTLKPTTLSTAIDRTKIGS